MVTVHLALCSFVVYVAVHKTADFPLLQFITVVDTSFVAQRQILMVQSIQLRIWWSMSLFAGFPQVQTWIVSQLQPLSLGLGVQACMFHRCGL